MQCNNFATTARTTTTATTTATSTAGTLHVGIAGGAGPNHSLADSGMTVAEIYNVSQPFGQRWSTVADSQIQRLYHSVAFLTANATVSLIWPYTLPCSRGGGCKGGGGGQPCCGLLTSADCNSTVLSLCP